MKTLNTTHYTSSQNFTITSSEVNDHDALLTNILFEKMKVYMEQFALQVITDFDNSPRLYKLQVLKNAYLGETLRISSYVEELIGEELSITVLVQNNKVKRNNTICKANFKLPVKNIIHKAS